MYGHRRSELPVAPASLATSSPQAWTHHFVLPLPYFLVYGTAGTLPISAFLFPSFSLSILKVEGECFSQRNAEDGHQAGGDQSICVLFTRAEGEESSCRVRNPRICLRSGLPGREGPPKPGRSSLLPGRAPHPKSPCVSIALFKRFQAK